MSCPALLNLNMNLITSSVFFCVVVVVVVLWNLFVYLFKRITEIEKNKNKTSTLWYIPQMLASAGAGLRQTKPRSQEFQQVSHMGTEAQVLLLSPGP